MSIFNSKLEKKIDKLAMKIEALKLNEYVEIMNNTKKLLWKNFMSGIAKGVGITIGFAVVSALLLALLRKLLLLNIPVIGTFIKDIIDIVETERR